MIVKSERNKRLEELQESFGNASSIYVTDITGIDVDRITKFRADLRGNNAKYVVVKNKIAKLAAERSGNEGLKEFFQGPTGVIITQDDPTAPARILKEFYKDNEKLLAVRGAMVEGSTMGQEDAMRLADIPTREVLLAQLLSVMQAPVTNFAGALNGILTKFVGVLTAVKDKKEQE